MTAYQRVLIILNPVSGQQDPAQTRQLLEDRLTREGISYEVRETKESGDALRWAQHAASEEFDLVVASGGDGTIMEAMSGLIKRGSTVPLGQVAAGGAKLLERAILIPNARDTALEVVFTGKAERLDVG